MNLESQVCSLELSKRLNELGVKQDSLFHWWEKENKLGIYYGNIVNDPILQWSAFTVAELGLLLPDYVPSKTASGSDKTLHYSKFQGMYHVGVLHHNRQITPVFYSDNEASARAMMLIYLIEYELMEIPK